jgi:tetratricopeptide (TPR) repeat protein
MRANRFGLLLGIAGLALWAAVPALASEATRAFGRGVQAFEQNRYAEAEEAFAEAVRRDPDWARAHYHLGLARARRGDTSGAIDAYEGAEARDPDLPGLPLSLGIARYETRDYERAEPLLERAARADPTEGSAHFFLGLTHQQQDRHLEAIADFERAAARDPGYRQLALYQQGISHRASGDLAAAEAALERAVAEAPDSDTAGDARTLLTAMRSGEGRRGGGKPWSVSARMGMSIEDNVTVPEVDVSSGEADVAGLFELGGSYRFVDTGPWQAEVAYDFYQSLYADLSSADLQSHSVSLEGTRNFDASDANLAWRFNTSKLDGDDFVDTHTVNPWLGHAFAESFYATAGYEYWDKDFDFDDRRDAGQHALALHGYYFVGDSRTTLSAGYRLEDEDADGAEYDYLGHGASVRFATDVPIFGVVFDVDLAYRLELRDYANVTPSIGTERDDDRHRIRFGIEKPLLEYATARFEYRHLTSSSNLPEADYDENTVEMTLGVEF